jgi:hypothetical protein
MADLEVTATGATAHVGETAKGGDHANRGDVNVSANHVPVVHAPPDRTIPMRTPFRLTGHGYDRDGDRLTYLWEQNDIGADDGTPLVSNTKTTGPLFRVFGTYADVSDEDAAQSPAPGENNATGSPTRTFPDMAQVLAGSTNARTGRCPEAPPASPDVYVVVPVPIVDCFSEFLPVKGYVGRPGSSRPAMHFRLTARDGQPDGGGVAHADVTLRLSPDAGPFLVTSFAQGGSVKGGSRATIRWAVNGTRPLAPHVRVLLSTDDGATWRRVLARWTRNDGAVTVRIPRVRTSTARVMVRAWGNYFFAVNDKAFTIR